MRRRRVPNPSERKDEKMKKYFVSMMLLPALAMAEGGELARCEQTFRDNMDIMAFPIYCTQRPTTPSQDAALQRHLDALNRCEAFAKRLPQSQHEQMMARLDAYVKPAALKVRALSDRPQEFQQYCTEQLDKAARLLQKY